MPKVSNPSPISNLAWIGRLDRLRDQFSEVWILETVEMELRKSDLAQALGLSVERYRRLDSVVRAAQTVSLHSVDEYA